MTPQRKQILSAALSVLRKQGHKQVMLSYTIRDGLTFSRSVGRVEFIERHLVSVISTEPHSIQKWCNDHSGLDTHEEEIRIFTAPVCAAPKLIKKGASDER